MRITDPMHGKSQSHKDIQRPHDTQKHQSMAEHCSTFFSMLLDVAGDSDALAKARVPAPLPERSKSGDVNQRVNVTHTECSSCPGSSVLVSAVAARPLSSYPVEEKLKIQ